MALDIATEVQYIMRHYETARISF